MSWRGAITFGLVNIPVTLHRAAADRSVRLRQIHLEDRSPIRHRRFCETEHREVSPDEIGRGFQAGPHLVEITDDDLEHLPLPAARQLRIEQFAPIKQIPPMQIGRNYHVAADSGAERAYVLLRDVLDETGRCALGRIALRQRERLALIRAEHPILIVSLLYWPDELNDPTPLAPPAEASPEQQERDMARTLVESLSADFDPEGYADHYREALMQLAEAKLAGQRPEASPEAAPVLDLADALNASLQNLEQSGE